MRVIRIAGCSLLLAALFMMAIIWNASPVAGECASCKAAGSSAEQDPLNQQWASFLGEVGAWSQMPFHPGLLRAQSDSSNCSSLWGENGERGLDLNLSAPKDGLQKYQGNRSDMARGMGFSTILISPEEIKILDSSDIIIDISPRSTEYIPGAISIPYDRFIDPAGRLEPIGEMTRILGDAGVSENDSIIIYGECQPCGGGPSAATYVFWMLKFLGHEDVRLLDGGIDDWIAASNPTWSEPARLAPRNYTPAIDADLLATYDFVCSGIPQIIDARTGRDFEAGSIPGAINIPYTSVLDGKKIKDQSELEEIFSDLQRERPVVVYTNTGVKASMIWLPLSLLGYDAKVYAWQDWKADHSSGEMTPANIRISKRIAGVKSETIES